jgi:bifunctional non-homologous end joining protein LigD
LLPVLFQPVASGGVQPSDRPPYSCQHLDQAGSCDAKQIAQRLAAATLDCYTISSAPDKRTGRIFIDYLRNGRGTTAIGAWSPRARAGFPIAAAVSWRQVENGICPVAFTMDRPPRR